MLTAFYILILQQIAQGLYALVAGMRWLRWVRERLAHHPGFYTPRVALLCPCKGMEAGLEDNLTALTQFDYPDYEIFFALASATDAAHAVIKRVIEQSKRPAHIVIAGPSQDSTEKVHNLLAALAKVSDKFAVLVFADSDGRPGRRWLERLVAPLVEPKLGAATTYRWHLPVKGGWPTALLSAWNAGIVTMLGNHGRNFCWGGGTALRRQTFDQIKAFEYWKGAASDDLALTRALREQGRAIQFVPGCLIPTLHDADYHHLLEFTNRQFVITRVYAPRMWRRALLVHLSYCVTLLYALWVCIATSLETGLGTHILLLTLLVPLLAAGKGAVRLMAAMDLLPEWRKQVLAYSWTWTLLAPLVPFLYLWNGLVSLFTRRIRWRGVRYELVSPNQTRVISR